MKRVWRGNAVEAAVGPDPLEPDEQIVMLTVQLAAGPTPAREAGRPVDVILTRPMLRYLADLAADVGAVHGVDLDPPSWAEADDTTREAQP